VRIFPSDSSFVPKSEDQSAALDAFRKFAPKADAIEAEIYELPQFFYRLEMNSIKCPVCDVAIDSLWWSTEMERAFQAPEIVLEKPSPWKRIVRIFKKGAQVPLLRNNEGGFAFEEFSLPECGHPSRLDHLNYDPLQGFGRFCLSGRNLQIGGVLSDEQVSKLADLLQCEVVATYERI